MNKFIEEELESLRSLCTYNNSPVFKETLSKGFKFYNNCTIGGPSIHLRSELVCIARDIFKRAVGRHLQYLEKAQEEHDFQQVCIEESTKFLKSINAWENKHGNK